MVTALLLALAIGGPEAAPPAAHAADSIAWLVEPSTAVEYVLAGDAAPPPPPPPSRPTAWDGALGAVALRGFFVSYRTVLASQDDGPCGFVPSCSAFSEEAISRFGVVEGLLLTADRLLRDHPLAVQLYRTDAGTGRLVDPPSRYAGEAGR